MLVKPPVLALTCHAFVFVFGFYFHIPWFSLFPSHVASTWHQVDAYISSPSRRCLNHSHLNQQLTPQSLYQSSAGHTHTFKMHFTLPAIAVLIFAGLAAAAPANERRQFEAQITFTGAAGADYSISAPTDGSKFDLGMHFPVPPTSNEQ